MKQFFRFSLVLALFALPLAVFAQEAGFVPLTDIDAIKYVGNQNSLPDFLNSIYRVCIGLAAVIGVLQLMRAGLTWMTAGGSHEKIGQARGLIRDTLLGLLLVLAPTIVFSIINPSILDLEITGLKELSVPQVSPDTTTENADFSDPRVCGGYSEFKGIQLELGQLCSEKLGKGWTTLNQACGACSSLGEGYTCCGKDPNYTPPETGEFKYNIAYRYDDGAGDVCLAYDEPLFVEKTMCTAAFADAVESLQERGTDYAVAKTCNEASEHTPTPMVAWERIKDLPSCNF